LRKVFSTKYFAKKLAMISYKFFFIKKFISISYEKHFKTKLVGNMSLFSSGRLLRKTWAAPFGCFCRSWWTFVATLLTL